MTTEKLKLFHVYRIDLDGVRISQMTARPATLRECQILIQRQSFTCGNKFEIVEVVK